jgi:hypothetical protein
MMSKHKSLDKIKNQKKQWYDRVIDTILEEWIGGGSKKAKVPAEKYKAADIPAHDKHTYRDPYDSKTNGIYISHIFRREIKRISTKGLHE